MSMTLSRNGNGYDISSQNYFRDLNSQVKEQIEPVRHQSVSEARAKLRWEGFEYLLSEANLENAGLSKDHKFKGHTTRGLDGTSLYVPRADELLEHFSLRNTKSEEGKTHYPYGLSLIHI